MKTRCIIVEDEALARGVIEKYCARHPDLDLVAAFPAAEPALQFLANNETGIIFLDVMLPGINGFEFLDKLPYFTRVILITSETSFAFTAFQYHVTDYLQKPVAYARFEEAVGKALDTTSSRAPEIAGDLFIKSEGSFARINFADILYLESMGDYVKYVTVKGEFITHSTFKAAAARLDDRLFMKVHRCFIVNLSRVTGLEDYELRLGNLKVAVSKPLRGGLMQRLNIAP